MEAAKPKGVVKHILLAKFKDDIPPDQIDQLIKGYANLVHHIEPMKSFHWYRTTRPLHVLEIGDIHMRGKDVSIENLHQGFTHVFESTFESVEGIAEYLAHPAHVEFANILLPVLEKSLVVDYKPEPVQL